MRLQRSAEKNHKDYITKIIKKMKEVSDYFTRVTAVYNKALVK